MITRIYINGLFERNAGPELLSQLARIYPEGRERHFFKAMLPEDDKRTRQILDLLHEAGWVPEPGHFRENRLPHEFTLVLHRDYDAADLAAAEYLELKPADYLYRRDMFGKTISDHPGGFRDQTALKGRIKLERRFLRRDIDIGCTESDGRWPVVPNRVRKQIELAGLRHVLFKPTVLVRRALEAPMSWGEPEEPWWELSSDLVLPPLSPSADLRDKDGKPIKPGDLSNGCYLIEGLYAHPELRYKAADLKKTGPFDLAHAFESFDSVCNPEDRPLVASQRFYRFCVEHKFKVDWVPVRIDP